MHAILLLTWVSEYHDQDLLHLWHRQNLRTESRGSPLVPGVVLVGQRVVSTDPKILLCASQRRRFSLTFSTIQRGGKSTRATTCGRWVRSPRLSAFRGRSRTTPCVGLLLCRLSFCTGAGLRGIARCLSTELSGRDLAVWDCAAPIGMCRTAGGASIPVGPGWCTYAVPIAPRGSPVEGRKPPGIPV